MEPTNDASQQLKAVYTEELKKHFVETDKSTINVKSNFTSLYFLRKV